MERRRAAIQAGVLLTITVPIAMAGGILPAEIQEAEEGRQTYVAIAHHVAAFRVHVLVGLVGAVVALVGLLRLAAAARSEQTARLVRAATVLAWVGTTVWVVVGLAGITVTVGQARDVAAGGSTPSWEIEDLQLLYAAALLAFPLLALAAGSTGLIGRRTGLVLMVLGCVGTVLFLGTHVTIFVIVFCVLPMGVLMLANALRRRSVAA